MTESFKDEAVVDPGAAEAPPIVGFNHSMMIMPVMPAWPGIAQ